MTAPLIKAKIREVMISKLIVPKVGITKRKIFQTLPLHKSILYRYSKDMGIGKTLSLDKSWLWASNKTVLRPRP